MEDYDGLSAGPNQEGQLKISYQGWKQIPSELVKFANTLVSLDISFNQVTELSASFGSLILLEELNASHNCITRIHSAIGCCIRLKEMNVSHNQLTSIPKEIAKCFMLVRKSIRLNENKIKTIPRELDEHPALCTLDVRKNNLHDIPCGLSQIPTLKQILCDGNDELQTIPKGMQTCPHLVTWCLRLHKENEAQVLSKLASYYKLEKKAIESEEQRMAMQEKEQNLENEIAELEKRRPLQYLNAKLKIVSFTQKIRSKINKQ